MINVGIIGVGRIGRVHGESISKYVKNAQVKAVADPFLNEKSIEWANSLGIKETYKDYKKILEDPEISAVLICASTDQHSKLSMEALKAGKHVFCEKPLAETVEKCKEAEKIIEAHPDTEFLFFFPPYSLARWYEFYAGGTLHYHLNQKEALTGILLGYDNVQVYDFQARTDIITNLDLYIDAGHYGPEINDAMIEAISRGECRVTDAAQAQKNDDLLCALVDQLVLAGGWPESFVY